MSYIESPDGGTRHAWFGNGIMPEGWRIVEGDIPSPPPPKPPVDILALAKQAKDFDDFKALLRAAKETP